MDDVLVVEGLKKYYPRPGGVIKAVDGVSFRIPQGKTMALVGESGCGKSTTGRMVLRLGGEKTAGRVEFMGKEIYDLPPEKLRRLRPKMQMIFQDPFSSLSPRLPVGELVAEAVREHKLVAKAELEDYVNQTLIACGLQPQHRHRYPHQFSGGQRQRICIARALALQPSFVVCDEAVSALDVSVQAQIVNLLQQLQQEKKISYLFISHDLSVVEHISHTVGVMYLGNIVEQGSTEAVFGEPLHPYTQALFSAIPVADPFHKPQPILLQGAMPSPAAPPPGCKFHPRCPRAMEICRREVPDWIEAAPEHFCACHLYNKS